MQNNAPDNLNLASDQELALSRRRLLLGITAGAVAATMGGAFNHSLAATTAPQGAPPTAPQAAPTLPLAEGRIQRAVALRAQPFNLTDVRLLDGPFLAAQQRDAKYLLTLEPDRMLHNFRVNAGLEPKAPVYGGWESVQTWADIRAHGHTLGHYLSACAMMFASTGDAPFKQRCDYIVAQLQECQTAGKTGLVCAFPDGAAQFDNMVAQRRIVGVPWYTTHKIFAGLRDVHLYCDSRPALDVLVKLCDWAQTTTANLTDQQFQRMLNTEHGGMNEILADVYVLTGDSKYLQLAQRFCHHAVLDPLSQQRDTLDSLHSNTQIPKFVGFNRLYGLTGQADYLAASKFFWQTITEHRSFATGGNGDREHFFPPTTFQQHLGSAKTMETCCTYNMLRLTRMLFALDPSAAYADYYERALYNGILASQDPDSGMMTYFQPTRPGYLKLYCTPIDSFWCCTGTGIENHAKYGDSIYFHTADALYVNLFIPSTLAWKEKGLTLTQTTAFPDEPTTKLKLTLSAPAALTLSLRHPAWCQSVTVKVNGQIEATSQSPGSYIALARQWRTGDVVELDLPMKLHAEPLPGAQGTIALLYGPIVLAGKLGTQGLSPGADLIINERTYGDMLNDPVDVPALPGEASQVVETIKPTPGAALTFTAPVPGRPEGLTFIPYFRIAHERYSIYWKVDART
jgi:hypothetical protein